MENMFLLVPSSSLLLCCQQAYMILRPHVKEFLQSMAKIYEVRVNPRSIELSDCLLVQLAIDKCRLQSVCFQWDEVNFIINNNLTMFGGISIIVRLSDALIYWVILEHSPPPNRLLYFHLILLNHLISTFISMFLCILK